MSEQVVTVGKFQGGPAFNVIPGSVTIGGTFRAFSKESFKQLRQCIEEVITGQAAVQRCNAVVNFLNEKKPFYPPTVSNGDLHEHFLNVAGNLLFCLASIKIMTRNQLWELKTFHSIKRLYLAATSYLECRMPHMNGLH